MALFFGYKQTCLAAGGKETLLPTQEVIGIDDLRWGDGGGAVILKQAKAALAPRAAGRVVWGEIGRLSRNQDPQIGAGSGFLN